MSAALEPPVAPLPIDMLKTQSKHSLSTSPPRPLAQTPIHAAATKPRNVIVYDSKGFAHVRPRKYGEEKDVYSGEFIRSVFDEMTEYQQQQQ